jgi:Iron-containing redox enzyme
MGPPRSGAREGRDDGRGAAPLGSSLSLKQESMSKTPGSNAGPASARLRTTMRLAEHRLSAPAQAFWSRRELPRMLPDFLFTVYCICRSTVPLLRTAAERARAGSQGDPLGEPLARYYARHAREELHHDEWMLEDMVAFGMNRVRILARMPSPPIASLIGSQYYWIFHAHPAALLGYLAVLEGYPPSAAHLHAIQAEHRVPPETFRTLLKHAQLDSRHRDDLNEQLDQLPLSEEMSSLISMSAFHTMDAVGGALEAILDSHRRPKR